MRAPAKPQNESERLAALLNYDVLDTPAEDVFDDLTRVAARICGTPIALVSLVDANRQWFKSRFGLEAPETPRSVSFCGHVVADALRLEVNALEDPRFADNPLVTGAPDIRFYAGEPLRMADGHILGTLCVIDRRERALSPEQRDSLHVLARQVVTQLELRRQGLASAAMAGIVETTDEAMFSVDGRGALRVWNPAAAKLFGWAQAELGSGLGRLDPEPNGSLAELVNTAQRGQSSARTELRLRGKGGRELDVEISVNPTYDASGDPNGAIGVIHDVSERRRTARLQHELLSTVSHELRTPLTSIRGSLGLLLAGVMGEFEEKPTELLRLADRNAQRLTRLVSDFLDVEKIEAGMLVLNARRHPIQTLFSEAAEAARGYAVDSGIAFEVAVCEPPLTERFVVADSDAVSRVVDNLVSNAVKHSPKGGTVQLGAKIDGSRVVFQVHDRGPGIPADFRDRLFRKFTQADASDGREHPGTGLGLAICRGLAREMDGEVWFDDREGGGTTFSLGLPLADAD